MVDEIANNKVEKERAAISEFLKIIRPEIEELGYKISDQKKLPYTNFCNKVDKNGNGINYSKGQNQYVTDILIYRETENKEIIPLVVIEGKIKKHTTHDAITYSEKANAHKRIFPHLQYGFIVLDATESKFSPTRYFIHKQFDFEEIFPAKESSKEKQIRTENFVSELKKQIELAEKKYFLFFDN